MQDRLTVDEVAAQAGCTHWTVRNYLRKGVIEGLRGRRGQWFFALDAPRQVREHMARHGGPGGMPLVARR